MCATRHNGNARQHTSLRYAQLLCCRHWQLLFPPTAHAHGTPPIKYCIIVVLLLLHVLRLLPVPQVDVAHQGLSQRYDPPPGTFLNEPIFVPRSNSSTASDSAGSTTSDSSTDGSVTSGSTASSTNKADGAADVSPGAVAENNMGCGGDDKMCPADWGVEGDGVDGQGAEAGPTPNNNPSAGEEGTAATDSQGGGEDDGWVLMQAFDAHNMHSELWVFDAR